MTTRETGYSVPGTSLASAALAIACAIACGTSAKPHDPTIVSPVESSIALPDTPAGRQLTEWLRLFNGADRDAYRVFMETQFPSEKHDFELEWRLRAMSGGYQVRRVESSSPTTLVVLVQERDSDQHARITFEVASSKPHLITRFDQRGIPTPPELAVPRLNESELVAALREKLDRDAAADRFAGAALLARDGEVIFARPYGLADREHALPNRLDTRFRIGSMSKMFTGVAIVQLAQAGKLSLDEPLGTYLTDYPSSETAKVTLAQLLTHTGGTGDIFGPQFDAHRLELRALGDYVKLYGDRAPAFEPGSQWAYSNYGFILLGLVIERTTGQSYDDYVRTHIFEPAGMTRSGSRPEEERVPDLSIGYTRSGENGPWKPNTDTLPYRGTSAGGGYTTVGDLLRFAVALRSNLLLDAEHTALLTTGKVDTPGGGRYAYGFGVLVMDDLRCFGHTGGAPGMGGVLWICPSSGYVIAVLGNVDPLAVVRVSDFVINRMPTRTE